MNVEINTVLLTRFDVLGLMLPLLAQHVMDMSNFYDYYVNLKRTKDEIIYAQ